MNKFATWADKMVTVEESKSIKTKPEALMGRCEELLRDIHVFELFLYGIFLDFVALFWDVEPGHCQERNNIGLSSYLWFCLGGKTIKYKDNQSIYRGISISKQNLKKISFYCSYTFLDNQLHFFKCEKGKKDGELAPIVA